MTYVAPMNAITVSMIVWLFVAGVTIDGDDPAHINWIMARSQERADEFNIPGINYRLTQGELAQCWWSSWCI